MSYERHDAGRIQSGVRHTAPNVDRVMGLETAQEATVDRLLTVVERLTAELATTQRALHDLDLEVARAGLGSGRPGPAPSTGYDTGAFTDSSGTVALAANHPSSLPPRRADHAVVPAHDAFASVPPRYSSFGPPPAVDAFGALPPAPTVTFDDGLVASLDDVQLLSTGAVDVMVGPVRDLADLDALESRFLAMQGVEAVTVMAFEGRDVLVKVETERPLPLAGMLRTELGRPVDSCRLVEGRIVVTFADAEAAA